MVGYHVERKGEKKGGRMATRTHERANRWERSLRFEGYSFTCFISIVIEMRS
jgi:hypothetical protein